MAKKCQSRKKNGENCGADAQSGANICVFHDPRRARDGRRARREGGINRSRRAAVLPPDTPDHPLANTKDISDLLADSINQLRRGQLDPRLANTVGYLASILLRALEQGPLRNALQELRPLAANAGQEKMQ